MSISYFDKEADVFSEQSSSFEKERHERKLIKENILNLRRENKSLEGRLKMVRRENNSLRVLVLEQNAKIVYETPAKPEISRYSNAKIVYETPTKPLLR